jgi:predicted dehydrogenase
MAKPVRVAMVGCGFFAQNHLHSWKSLAPQGAELVAVCDSDPAKAKAASEKFGAPAFTSAEKMLNETKPELVDIATRMDNHREMCALVGATGAAAVVQKPLAPTWEDCLAIADTSLKQNVFLAVHENFRFQNVMIRIARMIGEGLIGKPSWARIAFRTGYDVYKNQPYFYNEERLAIQDVGIHVLDLARVFLGEVQHVSCETQRRNPKVRAEDTATMMMRHASGAVSLVECTYEARKLPDVFPQTLMEIEGDEGSIVLLPDDHIRLTSHGKMTEEHVSFPLLDWMEKPWDLVQASVYNTNLHMLQCVQNGRKASTDILDNLKTFALVEAAYEAAAKGRAAAPPQKAT